MKKLLLVLMLCAMCLTGCAEGEKTGAQSSKSEVDVNQYNIGDEVDLVGVLFNVYKIDDNSLWLIAQDSIAITPFSADGREQKYLHDYEGSLIEGKVNRFVDDLENSGIVIEYSGIIDKDDLIDLGFELDGLNGTQYRLENTHDFIKKDEHFWVDGYCKYNTYAWVYSNGILTTQECEDEYGIRPIIVIDADEVGKSPSNIDTQLTIQEIVNSDCAWTSEGGIANSYDCFYFDCEQMLFVNIFESPELSRSSEFTMEFVDEKTIRVDGVRFGYEIPAEITIINENRLRVRFVDDQYNDGDYFLNKASE